MRERNREAKARIKLSTYGQGKRQREQGAREAYKLKGDIGGKRSNTHAADGTGAFSNRSRSGVRDLTKESGESCRKKTLPIRGRGSTKKWRSQWTSRWMIRERGKNEGGSKKNVGPTKNPARRRGRIRKGA